MPKEATVETQTVSYVYFAQTECGRYAKIGCSRDPWTRISGVKREARLLFGHGNVRMLGAIVGGTAEESRMHNEFAADRLELRTRQREWFHASAVVRFLSARTDLVTTRPPHPKPQPGRILTPQEVAERLKVDLDTVRRWLNSGLLKGTKIGGGRLWRVLREDLDRFERGEKNV